MCVDHRYGRKLAASLIYLDQVCFELAVLRERIFEAADLLIALPVTVGFFFPDFLSKS